MAKGATRIRRDIDPRFKDMSQRQLADYIHQMGKVANTRLRELEKTKYGGIQKSSNAYRYVMEKAKAERDSGEQKIFSVTRSGDVKFMTATRNFDIRDMMERATQISRFLSARTSTVTGTRAVYEDAFVTWKSANEESEVTKEDWSSIFSSAILQNYKQQYGSDELEKLVQKSKEYFITASEIEEALKSVGFSKESNFDYDKEIPLTAIYEALSNYRYR